MSRQGGRHQQKRKVWFWTPPTAEQRKIANKQDRMWLRHQEKDTVEEDLAEYGDSARWMAVRAFMLELTDQSVSVVQQDGPPTMPIKIPRSMIGNDHELDDRIFSHEETILLVRRDFALRRRLVSAT